MGVPWAPFPESEDSIELDCLSLAKVLKNDTTEMTTLISSCKSLGFFLLDMTDSQEGKAIFQDAVALFKLASQIFDQELEEKQKYAMLNGTVLG